MPDIKAEYMHIGGAGERVIHTFEIPKEEVLLVFSNGRAVLLDGHSLYIGRSDKRRNNLAKK